MINPESLKKIATQKMPYGKYAGTLLIDLPEPYVIWIYQNALPKNQFGKILAELYEIKVNGLEELVKSIQFEDEFKK